MNQYLIESFSEAGRDRPNQDAILHEYMNGDTLVLAIADGMGGEKGGAIASQIAIDTVRNEISHHKLSDVFQKVKNRLADFASHHSDEFSRMGTTLTVAIISKNEVEVGHVGDTRLYQIHDNDVITRTKDQTEVQKLIDLGVLTPTRAKRYPRKHVLLSALTPNSDFEFQNSRFSLSPNDKLLLLTDGAYSLLDTSEITQLSKSHIKTESYISALKESILNKEIKDDYSAIVMALD